MWISPLRRCSMTMLCAVLCCDKYVYNVVYCVCSLRKPKRHSTSSCFHYTFICRSTNLSRAIRRRRRILCAHSRRVTTLLRAVVHNLQPHTHITITKTKAWHIKCGGVATSEQIGFRVVKFANILNICCYIFANTSHNTIPTHTPYTYNIYTECDGVIVVYESMLSVIPTAIVYIDSIQRLQWPLNRKYIYINHATPPPPPLQI